MSSPFLGFIEALAASVPPSDVLCRAAVAHLAFASAVKAAGHPSGGREDVARHLAGSATFYQEDDQLVGGVSTAAICAVLWSLAEEGTAQDLLRATVVGAEIGCRLGLALSGEFRQNLDTRPSAAAAAAAAASFLGRSPEAIASAVALALQSAPELDYGTLAANPGEAGSLAAVAALRALGGQDAALPPLPDWVWAGAGENWLTRSLAVKALAGRGVWRVALEAVNEILHRHMKAADKRLRAEQVEKIQIRLSLPAWLAAQSSEGPLSPGGAALSLKQSLGVLVAQHRLDQSVLSSEALAEKARDIEHVASRVELSHDWKLSLGDAEARLAVLHRAGLPALKKALALAQPPVAGDLLALLRSRPDRALRELLRPPGIATAEHYGWNEPVEVKLYTTRGGWWPERRSQPLGIGEQAEVLALQRFGGGGESLLTPSGTAQEWLKELGA